jgi:putative ABC transport system permease protein
LEIRSCIRSFGTREIGLRVALGASPAVIRLVVRHAMTLTVAGLVIGLAGAVLLGRLIAHLLFELTQTDPATLAAVAVGLGSVAVTAGLLPALRALRVDPVAALGVDSGRAARRW